MVGGGIQIVPPGGAGCVFRRRMHSWRWPAPHFGRHQREPFTDLYSILYTPLNDLERFSHIEHYEHSESTHTALTLKDNFASQVCNGSPEAISSHIFILFCTVGGRSGRRWVGAAAESLRCMPRSSWTKRNIKSDASSFKETNLIAKQCHSMPFQPHQGLVLQIL